MSEHNSHAEGHGDQLMVYFLTTLGLMFFTVITVVISYLDMGLMNMPVALLIASTKGALVFLFYMHLRHEGPMVWLYAMIPFILLSLLMGIDYVDWFDTVNPQPKNY